MAACRPLAEAFEEVERVLAGVGHGDDERFWAHQVVEEVRKPLKTHSPELDRKRFKGALCAQARKVLEAGDSTADCGEEPEASSGPLLLVSNCCVERRLQAQRPIIRFMLTTHHNPGANAPDLLASFSGGAGGWCSS